MAHKILLLGSLLGLAVLVSSQGCSQCAATLFEMQEKYGQNSAVPNYDERTIDNFCSEYFKTNACLSLIADECGDQEMTHVSAVLHSWEYMCTDGKEVYLRNKECFKEPLRSQQLQNCTYTFTSELVNLGMDEFEKTCLLAKKFTTCVSYAFRSCDREALRFVFNTLERMLNITAKENGQNCTLDRDVRTSQQATKAPRVDYANDGQWSQTSGIKTVASMLIVTVLSVVL